uniref:Uncharacterized protein n=1 Tax=Nelumbo nucifera TaxID=4432 RepID=A0A822ZLN6_NELNU|nr:TPA_asm: hypothetical protein HUJ06_003397 [Nelumbo nucifera]DAD45807.1 TPA_asm: hypothetical protein HUJ06_004037 [Nelumbo nucifera]DAD46373.1 TPA_asm: hypothetical protein HUJ06_004603 [Nelumbo nucifera]
MIATPTPANKGCRILCMHAHHHHENNLTSKPHAQQQRTICQYSVKLEITTHYFTKTGGLGTIDLLMGKRRRVRTINYHLDQPTQSLWAVRNGQVSDFLTGQILPPKMLLARAMHSVCSIKNQTEQTEFYKNNILYSKTKLHLNRSNRTEFLPLLDYFFLDFTFVLY